MTLQHSITVDTFEEYLTVFWKNYHMVADEQRMGQAMFNFLYTVHPNLANQLRATPVDCFYDNDLIPVFLAAAGQLWETPR